MHSHIRRAARIAGRALAVLLGVAVLGAGTVYGLSERRMHARFAVPAHPLVVPTDSAAIARGRHLAAIDGCTDCHGPTLTGATLVESPLVGRLIAPNITRGGRGAALTPLDWERAVRHGVRRDGSPLLLMPAAEFATLTDEELGAIVAYATSVPSDPTVRPPPQPGPLVRAMFLAGKMILVPAERVDHAAPHAARIVEARTVAFGQHLAAGCVGCHGATYAGGPIAGAPPDWPPAANLRPGGPLGTWSEADFRRALRDGRRPDGSAIDAVMPVRATRQMTDVEIGALWDYLRTLTPRPSSR